MKSQLWTCWKHMKNKVSLKKKTKTTTSSLSKKVEISKNQVEMLGMKNVVTQKAPQWNDSTAGRGQK